MTTIKVKGARAMATLLNKLPKRITKKILRSVLRKAAKPIIIAARIKVPKDFRVLQKSMGTNFVKGTPPRKEIIRIGPRHGKKQRNDGWYAHLVEFGTQSHTVKGDPLSFTVDGDLRFVSEVTIPSIPAQPFLGPAFDATAGKSLKVIGNELGSVIENEARKLVKSGKL